MAKFPVPVEFTLEEIKEQSAYNDPIGAACRAWLAANAEPEPEEERAIYALPSAGVIGENREVYSYGDLGYVIRSERLQKDDVVAGRTVLQAIADDDGVMCVKWTSNDYAYYPPGTAIFLDLEP